MMMTWNILLFLFLLFATNDILYVVANKNHSEVGPTINFLAIGDWGGTAVPPYYKPGQKKTAVGMAKVAKEIHSKFVIALGDNFYEYGVNMTNLERFNTTFQSIYNFSSLMTPWYIIGGNHDHLGNITEQIAYTNKPLNINKRWQFPSLYHSHSFVAKKNSSKISPLNDVTVDIILIDTVDLCNVSKVQDENEIGYFDPLPLVSKSHAADDGEQWRWIEKKLASSKADYLLVGGHYPLYSVCEHGPTETLIKHLRPLLLKYKAHYMSGHDHCMIHIQEDIVHHILTGMGDECCYNSSNLDHNLNPEHGVKWFVSNESKALYHAEGGFTSFSATKQHMIVKYHQQDGHVLYTADPILPRARWPIVSK